MRAPLVSLTLGLFSVLLAACSFPTIAGGSGPYAWIDAPLDGSVVPLGAPVQIVSHASAASSISKVELSIDNSVLSTDDVPEAGQAYVVMNQSWIPTQPGTYQVRVRSQTAGGQWSNYAVVNVTVQAGPSPTPPPSDTPTPVITLTPTLVITFTPTSLPAATKPTFTLIENAFCRTGPDVSFPDVTALPKGETAEIRGVSEDGFWYYIFWAKFNTQCWIAAPAGQTSGDLQGVPVLVSPQTVTDTPAPGKKPKPTAVPTGYKP